MPTPNSRPQPDDPDALDMAVYAAEFEKLSTPAKGCIWLILWLAILFMVLLSAMAAQIAQWGFS